MWADVLNINAQILENLSRWMLQTLLVIELLALRDAALLADTWSALELTHLFFWHESLGPAEGQVKDILSSWTDIPQRDFAVAFGVQLALIADVQVLPRVVAIEEIDAIIPNVQQIDWRDAQAGQ